MNIQIKTYNTLPNSKDHWWQVVLFPTVSIMNNIQKHDPYIAINIEYLFWSFTTILNHGKKPIEKPAYFEG
jgi:hypothetical protein